MWGFLLKYRWLNARSEERCGAVGPRTALSPHIPSPIKYLFVEYISEVTHTHTHLLPVASHVTQWRRNLVLLNSVKEWCDNVWAHTLAKRPHRHCSRRTSLSRSSVSWERSKSKTDPSHSGSECELEIPSGASHNDGHISATRKQATKRVRLAHSRRVCRVEPLLAQ